MPIEAASRVPVHPGSIEIASTPSPAPRPTSPAIDTLALPEARIIPLVGNTLSLALLQTLAREVAPLVERATGWSVDLGKVYVGLADPARFTQMQLDSYRVRSAATGGLWSKVQAAIKDQLIPPEAQIAIFEPNRKPTGWLQWNAPPQDHILVQTINARQITPDALRATLFGMLIHVAQKQRFPTYYKELEQIEVQYVRALARGGAQDEATLAYDDSVQARRGWLRGQVRSLQDDACRTWFPHAAQSLGLGGLVRGFYGSIGYPELFSERDGKQAFEAMKDLGPSYIERNFNDPRFVEAILRRRGEVLFTVSPGQKAGAEAAIAQLQRVAGRRGATVEVREGRAMPPATSIQ